MSEVGQLRKIIRRLLRQHGSSHQTDRLIQRRIDGFTNGASTLRVKKAEIEYLQVVLDARAALPPTAEDSLEPKP